MPDDDLTPDPLALSNVRLLLPGGNVRLLLPGGNVPQAFEAALAAAARRGLPLLDAQDQDPLAGLLLALQAAAEELEGIGAALAAGEGQGNDGKE